MGLVKSNTKHLPFFDMLCIFFIMWSSGTQFSVEYPYAMYGLTLSFFLIILKGDFVFNSKMSSISGVIILLDMLSVALNLYYYSGEDFALIQKNFFLLWIVMLYTLNKPERNKERLAFFVQLILFFSLISNILFIIHVTVGLPMVATDVDKGEHFYYLQKNIFNNLIGLPYRNSGIYWEPGMYQVYLSLALLFYLYYERVRFRILVIIYLIISVVSTFSVSGYLVCALIIGVYSLRNNKSTFLRLVIITTVIFMLISVMPYMMESFTMKQNTGSYESRSNDLLFGIDVFLRSPLVGFGVGSHEYVDSYAQAFGEKRQDSNGMIGILLSMGIVGAALVTYCYMKLGKWLKNTFSTYMLLAFFIWFIISINTEPITFHPFFFFLLGLGVSSTMVNYRNASI